MGDIEKVYAPSCQIKHEASSKAHQQQENESLQSADSIRKADNDPSLTAAPTDHDKGELKVNGTSNKRRNRSRKQRIPVTKLDTIPVNDTSVIVNEDSNNKNIEPKSKISVSNAAKRQRNRKKKVDPKEDKAVTKQINGETNDETTTLQDNKEMTTKPMDDKKSSRVRKKKPKKLDSNKDMTAETTTTGEQKDIPKDKKQQKKKKNKKKPQRSKEDATAKITTDAATTISPSSTNHSPSTPDTTVTTTQTEDASIATDIKGNGKVVPAMPYFARRHRDHWRIVNDQTEVVDFSDLHSHQDTTPTTATMKTVITSSSSSSKSNTFPTKKPSVLPQDNPNKTTKASESSGMAGRKKKPLSTKTVLDTTLSLENYFVPASGNTTTRQISMKNESDHNPQQQQVQQDHRKNQKGKQPISKTPEASKDRRAKKDQKTMDKNRQKSENRQSQQEKRQLGQKDQQKKSSTTEEYVHPDDKVKPGRRPRYLPYMAPDLIAKGIENNTLYQGILRINKRNRSDGYVTSDDLEHDIYIHGVRDRNRALEGDMVAIRLLDVETIWKHKKEKDQQKKKNTEDLKEQSSVAIEIGTDDEEEQEEEEMDKNKPKFCGQVVGIVHRMEGQQITGTLHIDHHQGPTIDNSEKEEDDDEDNDTTPPVPANNNHVRLLWFKPTDKRAPFIAIPVAQAPDDFLANPSKFDNEIFSAKITRWPIDSRYPFGKLICELGRLGEMVVEAKSILANNNILDADFSTKALKALPKTPWSIPEKEYKTRRDLRSTRIFTIDPETAKDLDDALHITRLEGDQYEVGVHIADVSYFLKRNTQLDVEAKERGTSTYLVDRVIPMLPSLLCEQLCSLNPGVERLAFSVIWKMDNTGHILDTWFGRTIIKSCAKLAYDDAQSVIEKKGLPTTAKVVDHSVSSVEQDILDLLKLSQCMRQRRFENGALSMNSIKLAFKLDEDGEPEKVWVYQLKEANRLIEEFMLRANMSVAEKLCQHYPGEAILRRHEHPIERRLDEFVQVAQDLGYYIDGSTSGTLQASFDAIESEDVKYVLRILAIKPMRRAKYFCTGSFDDISKYLHFALNVPMYTHFTSPIRRYADVMVHRQLESILQEKGDCGYSKKMVQAIALQCNRKKDGAKNAQEQSGHLYLSRYLARLPQPIVRTAIVLQVSNDVFDLLVPDYGLESRVYMDAMPLEQFRYDAVDNSLTVYWKKDGVMNMDTINSIREANQAANNNTSNELNDDKNSNRIDHSQQQQHNGLTFCRTDGSKRMQVFKTFGRFDVLIQVNDERTPPIINIYPINPFFETIE